MSFSFHSDVAERIARAYGEMSPSYRRIADYLLAQPAAAAAQTNVGLAELCGVSPATANRFARVVGYAGFQDFRRAQIEALGLAGGRGADAGPAVKLARERRRDARAADLIRESLSEDLDNLARTRDGLSDEACEKAVSMLLGARRVFCYGGGLSNVLMGLLTYELEPFCGGNVHQIQASHGITATLRKLAYLDESDLVVIAGFPRYAVETIKVAQIMRDQGVRLLAVTDRPSSPLAALADLTLYASAGRAIQPNSAAAAIALLEGLVVAVANRRAEMPGMRLREATRYFTEITDPSADTD